MSAPTPAARRVPRVITGAMLALLGVSAAYVTVVMVRASGYGDDRPLDGGIVVGLGFLAWALSPFVAMGVVVVVTARRSRAATVAVALGVAALAALTLDALRDFEISESSTAALLFVFLPIYQLLVVIVTGVVAYVIDAALRWWRGRRAARGR